MLVLMFVKDCKDLNYASVIYKGEKKGISKTKFENKKAKTKTKQKIIKNYLNAVQIFTN